MRTKIVPSPCGLSIVYAIGVDKFFIGVDWQISRVPQALVFFVANPFAKTTPFGTLESLSIFLSYPKPPLSVYRSIRLGSKYALNMRERLERLTTLTWACGERMFSYARRRHQSPRTGVDALNAMGCF